MEGRRDAGAQARQSCVSRRASLPCPPPPPPPAVSQRENRLLGLTQEESLLHKHRHFEPKCSELSPHSALETELPVGGLQVGKQRS